MAERELISVIIPVYRVERYIRQCVDSVLNQTYKNLEIILVDDGSDDKCPQICEEYGKSDARVKVIHQDNRGQDAARKAGILVAKGKYVGYVDGDDWIEPDMYEKLIGFAQKYQVDVVESGVIDSWEDCEKRRIGIFEEGCYKGEKFSRIIGPRLLYSGQFFKFGISAYLVTKLFLREKILEYQLMPEPTGNLLDDVMCTFPCIFASRSLYITHDCFYHYRVRETSSKRKIRSDVSGVVQTCYSNWEKRFSGAIVSDNIKRQIDYLTLFLLLSKEISVFDQRSSDYVLTPYGMVRKNSKIVLYGAGVVGINIYSYLCNTKEIEIVYWADKNYSSLQKYYDVGEPKKIAEVEYDYVIIGIIDARIMKSAQKDLLDLGVASEKILWIKDDYIQYPEKLLKIAFDNEEK